MGHPCNVTRYHQGQKALQKCIYLGSLLSICTMTTQRNMLAITTVQISRLSLEEFDAQRGEVLVLLEL